ncbi:hypothetical protein BIFGAL_03648 [Bifidobacterium gallicum DSM 20093 = LMG 11596]|uniref:Uncharacterized protein n=1 Tax=Bifidobacterium gallicum DSM 20093 = LMG 11596 TaxID=561180 RepID=D1NUX0_9BIFI|nr:hypothetical protein BIFGAL_03648 [Bifidobacterium gallicum DSM 20093 = LMG 11596]
MPQLQEERSLDPEQLALGSLRIQAAQGLVAGALQRRQLLGYRQPTGLAL